MYYYAHLNGSNLVDAVYAFENPTTEEGYVEITEAQYEQPIIEYRYYPESNYFEQWYWSCTTDDIKYPGTITMITTVLDDLEDGLNDKADIDHTHSDYATVTELDALEDEVDGKAAVNHSHSDYATTDHTHSNYSLNTHSHTASEVGAATSDHTHSNYASTTHNHDSTYSAIGHDHDDDYAGVSHTHSNYASATHNHDSAYSAINHDHNDDYAAANHSHSNYATTTALNELVTTVSGKANTSHSHNDLYYTETEIDTKLSTKANTSHSHNDVYYTETEIDTKLSSKADASHAHTGVYDTNGAAADALISANAYTDSKINALVGEGASTTLDTIGEIASAIEDNQDAIDLLNSAIGTKASTLDLNSHASDAEIHITATERSNWNAKSNFSGSYNDLTNKPTIPSISGLATETYVNEAVSAKANATHTHAISDVTNLQSALDGKAATSHGTHVSYSTTVPVMDGTASVGSASTVARSDHKHPTDTSRASQTDLSSHTSNTSNPHSVTKSQVGLGNVPNVATNDQIPTYSDTTTLATLTSGEKLSAAFAKIKLAITNLISHIANVSNPHAVTKSQVGLGNVDNTSDANKPISTATQTALNDKASSSHKHYATTINYTGEDLDDYTDAGTYTFSNGAAVSNAPAGTNGWLVVMPWNEGSTTIKQLWFRHGTVGSNDFETYVRTKVGSNSWGSWSKYYTTSNPPTYAEVGASPAFTNDMGGVLLSYTTSDGKNVLDEITSLSIGVYTIYCQSGVSGNPKTTEAWRYLVHKTGSAVCWVQAYGSIGSVYTNYHDGSSGWRGWKCLWDNAPAPLWTGAKYMNSTDSTPQVVTPSKKLSECQHGWLLLWSDYDPGDGANDADFVTTMIPKRNATGGTWGGKAFLCDIPRYIGSDATDTSTEKRIIKVLYVHDDCIKGSYQNASGDRNDVVLRAVYEF